MSKLWGDMTPLEQAKAATYLVRERGMTYAKAAEQLVASKGAIAGALYRAPTTMRRSLAQKTGKALAGDTKSRWSEGRLTEPWAVFAARRRAARARDRSMTNA